jgi:putative ABC transport system ATP-binding protein
MSMLLTFSFVTKEYPTHAEIIEAVRDLTFELPTGVVVGLVGPSGSGKTTLVNLIAGWELPTSGEIVWRADVGDNWESVAVIPQGLGLLAELSLAENVELPTRLNNRQEHSTEGLLADLGLAEVGRRLPEETSLGEQQRAAVARALVSAPLMLVADEPTAHQDEANAMRILAALRNHTTRDSTVLIATHDERILPAVDRVIRLEYGRIVDV